MCWGRVRLFAFFHCCIALAAALLHCGGPAWATVLPKVHVRFHPATREVVPGRAIPIDIEIVSKEDVGEVEFRLKPGAAWAFDSGDREWRGGLGAGSRVNLHAVLTPRQAKVDKVLAEVVIPERGVTVPAYLDLQPEIPVFGLGRQVPPGVPVVPNLPAPPGASESPPTST